MPSDATLRTSPRYRAEQGLQRLSRWFEHRHTVLAPHPRTHTTESGRSQSSPSGLRPRKYPWICGRCDPSALETHGSCHACSGPLSVPSTTLVLTTRAPSTGLKWRIPCIPVSGAGDPLVLTHYGPPSCLSVVGTPKAHRAIRWTHPWGSETQQHQGARLHQHGTPRRQH